MASALCVSSEAARSPLNLGVLARDGYGVVSITRPRPNEMLVRGTINGRDATLVLDTGWGGTGVSLDSGYANSLKLATGAVAARGLSSGGALMAIKNGTPGVVSLGNVKLTDVPLFVGGFAGLKVMQIHNPSFHADGFVSGGFLHTNSAILDLPNFRLYLRPPRKGRLAVLGSALKGVGLYEIPFTKNEHGNFLVDVNINGTQAKMVMDTGAYLSGVDARFAARIKARGYGSTFFGVDAAGLPVEKQLANLGTLTVGGVPVRSSELTISTYSVYTASGGKVVGLLGMDVLGQNWGIIDFGNRKLYLARAK